MTIAFWFLAVVGAAMLLLAVVFAYTVAVDSFLEWRHEPHQRSFVEGQKHALNRLRNDSWWFSESPETCELLADLSRGMEVGEAREKWRKARAEIQAEVTT